MIDLLRAGQKAAFEALIGNDDLLALGPVHQHVPENSKPPMTIVGNIESENIAAKGEQCERLTIEIIALFRGASRAPLLDIMHQQRVALDGRQLAHDGVHFGTPRFLGAVADGPASDGVTYAGISTFTIDAEPA
jgi:hypothetical protein